MSTLHLVCGLPCSGKTTFAKTLEQEHHALRLTPDEWHVCLFGQDAADDGYYGDVHTERHSAIEAMLWQVAARVLSLGTNVVLDFGFWSRVERDDFRSRAADLGAGFKLYYLEVPNDELLARLTKRNAHLPPGTFFIEPAQMKEWFSIFEPPTLEELGKNTS